jgi:hypothetical protein
MGEDEHRANPVHYFAKNNQRFPAKQNVRISIMEANDEAK